MKIRIKLELEIDHSDCVDLQLYGMAKGLVTSKPLAHVAATMVLRYFTEWDARGRIEAARQWVREHDGGLVTPHVETT